jgi:hypothetical protein
MVGSFYLGGALPWMPAFAGEAGTDIDAKGTATEYGA